MASTTANNRGTEEIESMCLSCDSKVVGVKAMSVVIIPDLREMA